MVWAGASLDKGKHFIELDFQVTPFGRLSFKVKDAIRDPGMKPVTVPYDKEDNYSAEIIQKRQRFGILSLAS